MPLSAEQIAEFRGFAEQLADAASAAITPYFRASLEVEDKGGRLYDPVTVADKAAEDAMRERIQARYPDHGILGEEAGVAVGSSPLTWVLDPIDGTRAFMSGAVTWGTLIAVNAGAAPVLGLVDQPYLGERFMGGLGRAAMRRNGSERALATRACSDLTGAILYSTFPEVGTPAERAGFERVRDQARLTRYGTDCYGYALVALGQADLVIEAGLLAYDVQGPQAVIEAAGGIFTDWKGRPAHQGGRVLAAGDARVHAAALALLSAVPD